MPKIICTLPNASDEISGVKFSRLNGDQLISEDISADQAELFLSIPGYFAEGDAPEVDEPKQAAAQPKQETAAQRKARLKQEEADALKAEQDRLAAEQERIDAEKAAAAAESAAGKADAPAAGGDKEEVF